MHQRTHSSTLDPEEQHAEELSSAYAELMRAIERTKTFVNTQKMEEQ